MFLKVNIRITTSRQKRDIGLVIDRVVWSYKILTIVETNKSRNFVVFNRIPFCQIVRVFCTNFFIFLCVGETVRQNPHTKHLSVFIFHLSVKIKLIRYYKHLHRFFLIFHGGRAGMLPIGAKKNQLSKLMTTVFEGKHVTLNSTPKIIYGYLGRNDFDFHVHFLFLSVECR